MKIKEVKNDGDITIVKIDDEETKTTVKDKNSNESLITQNKNTYEIKFEKDLEINNEQ
ncbi:hypothetical protein [Anaerococcus hydrogenalis]|uniref:hypothetical protein n=1 Tax=Anaerococcus hydrogenalis TaxID=33029 RepID=UPI002902102A|nr:hypothetical protein [Anaerococcus hydrogenalis]MDU1315703.1 hypothetical protein [Anaerococcus hydrogenalis]